MLSRVGQACVLVLGVGAVLAATPADAQCPPGNVGDGCSAFCPCSGRNRCGIDFKCYACPAGNAGDGCSAVCPCTGDNFCGVDFLCHPPCPDACPFPFADGNCPTLGCCGGEGQRYCVVGPGSDAPSACAPGLVVNSELVCIRPRTIGEDCGPAAPCLDPLQCVPFAQKCSPDAGEQIINTEDCLEFYNPDFAQAAIDLGNTTSYGLSAAAAGIAGGSFEVGNVYGEGGQYGCYLTYCFGIEANVAINASSCFGLTESWDRFAGSSFVFIQGAGEGVEFTTSQVFTDADCATSDPSPPCLFGTTDCVGAGLGISPFTIGGYQCETIVNTVLGGATPENSPPVAQCKNVPATAGAACSAEASIDDGSYDPDAGDVITRTQAPPGPYPLGATGVTLAVEDGNGGADTCTATVTVTDATAPAITACPDDITTSTGPGAGRCTQTATWTEPSATDNCAVASFTSTHAPGDDFPVGVTSVTYTAEDPSGNVATCSFDVTVVDDTPPRYSSCPADMTLQTGPGSAACGGVVSWTVPAAGDNCGLAESTASHTPGQTFAIGATTVTYSIEDPAGLAAVCSFLVTIVDDTPPRVSGCPADVSVATGPGATTCARAVTWTAPTASDNCEVDGFVSDHLPGQSFAVGETTVTYTAEDPGGLTSACTFAVTVEDDTLPQITCPAAIEVEADGAAGSIVSYAVDAADNCSATVALEPASGSVFPIGTTAVTATATDSSGNESSCQFDVHVVGADLAVSKEATPRPAAAGAVVRYTIELVNDGPDSAANVVLTDATPAGTTFVSLLADEDWACTVPPVSGTGAISCAKSAVASGERATFLLDVRSAPDLADGTILSNEAGCTSTTPDPQSGNDSAAVEVEVVTQADVAITDDVIEDLADEAEVAGDDLLLVGGGPPQAVLRGIPFRVTFAIANHGPSDAHDVEIDMDTPEHTTYLELLEPAGWTCAVPPAGGTGSIHCSTATLAAGAVAQFVVVMKVESTIPKGLVVTGHLSASSATDDPSLANNEVDFSLFVSRPAPLLGWVGLLALLLTLLALAGLSLRSHQPHAATRWGTKP